MRFIAVLLLLVYPFWSAPESEIKASAVTFRIRNAGITVNGTLDSLKADVVFDPNHPADARIQASIPVSTIRTGITLRDKHLQRPDYFYAEKYPVILLVSKTIRKISRGRYEGLFALTIKGTEREVTVPFTYSAAQEFNGSFRFNRLDFELGKSSLVLADEVDVQIQVKLSSPALPLSEKK